MRKILLPLLSLTLSLPLLATQPLRRTFSYTQPDGTTLKLTRVGNARFACYETLDGRAVLRSGDGSFRYALPARNGWLAASQVTAHDPADRTADETQFVESSSISTDCALARFAEAQPLPALRRLPARNAASTADGMGEYMKNAGGMVASIGKPTIPIIMAEFPDVPFQAGTTAEKLSRQFNETGYSDEPGAQGSVKQYFTEQSNGIFSPSFDIVGKVKMSHPRSYYGENYANGAIDMRKVEFVREAIQLAVASGADFSKYKTGDQDVPLVTIVYAGGGEHSSYEAGCEDLLWAHFMPLTVDAGGTNIRSYFIGNEMLHSYKQLESGEIVIKGGQNDGIGVFCHEFGHALGLPDVYTTVRHEGEDRNFLTPNYWSVMDYGQYFYNGYAPVGYTAYERAFMGWLRVERLATPAHLTLYPQGREGEGPTAFALVNPANASEYFILENRQPSTWHPKAMGHGMLVTHIDYLASQWQSNSLNNDPAHRRFSIVYADNDHSPRTANTSTWANYKGDLFPGTTAASSLTDTTTPSTAVFTGGALSQPLYNITETPEGLVTFSYLDPTLTSVSRLPLSPEADTPVHTLDGRRLPALPTAKGVYIVGKKKVVK